MGAGLVSEAAAGGQWSQCLHCSPGVIHSWKAEALSTEGWPRWSDTVRVSAEKSKLCLSLILGVNLFEEHLGGKEADSECYQLHLL